MSFTLTTTTGHPFVGSIAAGIPAATVAPRIRQSEAELVRIEQRLRLPRPEAPDVEALRLVLEQRVEDWRTKLRGETKVARMLLRRLLDPLALTDVMSEAGEMERWVGWESTGKPSGLLGTDAPSVLGASRPGRGMGRAALASGGTRGTARSSPCGREP